ncbi:MAG: hypothetical protein IPO15_13655 [Anaerolineae bacterium]|uniref:hypothetical protein n=1 Tax=Candidatus Amarolinea dominans TaxID=3140696 RepID=UPI003136EA7E|nr:hypothetical protein [Anaerolineae bacterium]
MTPLVAAVQAPPGTTLTSEYQEALDASRQLLTQFGDQYNLLSVLANGLLGTPSLISDIGLGQSITRQAGRLDLSSFGSLTGWLVGLLILSVIIGALYLVLIAQHVRAAPLSLPALARSFVRTLGRLLIFTLLIGLLLALAQYPWRCSPAC